MIRKSSIAVPLLEPSTPADAQASPLLSDAAGIRLYVAFLFLGVGAVLPTFVIFAAVDYFTLISPSGSLEFEINAWFNGMLFAVSVANALQQQIGFTVRIIWGFVATAACLVSVPVLGALLLGRGEEYASLHGRLLLLVAALMGAANATSQCSLFGLSSAAFPPAFTQALLTGVALCGTTITLTRAALKLFVQDGLGGPSAYAFFLFSAAYSCGSAVVFWQLRTRSDLFRAQLTAAVDTSPTLSRRAAARPGASPAPPLRRDATSFRARTLALLLPAPGRRGVGEACVLLVIVNAQFTCVVPSMVGLTRDFIGEGWSHVLAILAYNFSDLFARAVLAPRWPCGLRATWPAVVLRLGLIAAVGLCAPPRVLSGSSAPLLAALAALGSSTGYLSSCVMRTATAHVEPHDREAAGYLGVLSIFAGLIVGSVLAFPLAALVAGGTRR